MSVSQLNIRTEIVRGLLIVIFVFSPGLSRAESLYFENDPESAGGISLGEHISEYCNRILPDFKNLKESLQRRHPGWSQFELALNLMELGRAQTSGIDAPSPKDGEFILSYVRSLNFENFNAALFSAYSGGCIMGLVLKGELKAQYFIDALKLSSHIAQMTFEP